MRSVTRIFLVMMLFALAIWSVASVKADARMDATPGVGSTTPAMLIQVDGAGVMIDGDIDADGERCIASPGMFSAFNDPELATDVVRFASRTTGSDVAATPFSLQRL